MGISGLRRGKIRLLLASTLLGLSACSSSKDSASDYSAGANIQKADWTYHGRSSDEQRFSPLSQINPGTVSRLGLEWSLDLPGENALEATPLEVDGILYFSGSLGNVYAVDAVSGKTAWIYDPKAGDAGPRDARIVYGNNRGVAYWDGKVFVATKDGRMVALDAKTGKPVWNSRFLRKGDGSASSGAPRVLDGKIIIGNSGAELGARGYVTTLDAKTGKLLWRFFTVPGNPAEGFENPAMAMAAKTWGGEWWKHGGGGTPWNGITYDKELNQIYIGTGNGSPWNTKYRCPKGEDNLFLSSVVALDANTGEYKWHYQYNPCEGWDWKATADIVLADLKIAGQTRKVLMQAPSNGFLYVIDRNNGKLVSADKIGKATWADRIDLKTGRPVEKPGIRYENAPAVIYPSMAGAHNWQASSFNPRTGLLYLPYMQLGMKIARSDGSDLAYDPKRLMIRVGITLEPVIDPKDPLDGKGSLIAWDPVKKKIAWRVDYPSMWNAGTMTTAGDLVFQGTNTGQFYVYDARNGKRLWTFDAKLGILAPPVTYAIKGKQYVSLLVGYGAGAGEGGLPGFGQGWKFGLQPRRLLTFALDGKAQLPETPPPDFKINALDDPNLKIDPAKAKMGAVVYDRQCGLCHGAGGIATGGAPDLRESGVVFDKATFAQFLRSGALVNNGMPKFDDLTDPEIEAVYNFVRSSARQELAQAKKPAGTQ